MSKQTLELEVPGGFDLTGEIRLPRKGEFYFCPGFPPTRACTDHGNHPDDHSWVILRKAWEPPAWLPDGCWVYRTKTRGWEVCKVEPSEMAESGFYGYGAGGVYEYFSAEALAKLHGETFTPPAVNKIQVRR